MASIGKLWTIPDQAQGKRIKAAAAYAGLKLDLASDYVHKETNKSPEYTKKFASGKIPAFEGADGFTLFETTAIARYIASLAPNSTLLGTSPQEAALVDQWISFFDTEIFAHSRASNFLLQGVVPYNKAVDQAHRTALGNALQVLEGHLLNNTFVVGERPTLADFTGASVLQHVLTKVLDLPTFSSTYPNSYRYLETVANQPAVVDIFAGATYNDKPVPFAPKSAPKKEEKPKKEAAAPAPKKEKPKKEADDDEEEPLVPAEPKAKNPLDDLPKSNFNLEDWKRAYSNMDTRGPGGSLEWFYEKFDKEGFSIWKVVFKYNEELTQVFMSSNQIGGFFNRLEASRKYLFGSVGVLGAANDSIITGVLILRGPDYKPVVDVAPDWESYEYQALNPFSEGEDKSFFEGALAWDLEVGGKKWADGKNFK